MSVFKQLLSPQLVGELEHIGWGPEEVAVLWSSYEAARKLEEKAKEKYVAPFWLLPLTCTLPLKKARL